MSVKTPTPRGPKRTVKFGPELSQLRKLRGKTQEDIAAIGKISVDSVHRAERGNIGVSWEIALAIGDALQLTHNDIEKYTVIF